MENEEFFADQFIIRLKIDNTEYEEVEVELTDPYKSISDQIKSIVEKFELPKMDGGGAPITYRLGKISEDGFLPEILQEIDENGREQTLMDYEVQPGDELQLLNIPIAG